MDIVTTIECIAVLIIGTYCLGLLMVWICEIKRSALYRDMQKNVRLLESFRLSMAVFHAKEYKVSQDYRIRAQWIERAQQFILEKILFLGRKSQHKTSFNGVNR